ncbi:uncharacterized protein B0H64DRAFT_383133 [Chaetomium fimeti]|uniref:Uncharacterized protein n=1 Tax=Chaetomium fimeti TaxID=1854472 RepID=A0AAE0HRP4_9PEZI|nr:hypothetical protein B0H64DRAFT_383133 [Chaetomium fimeti]
MQRTRVVISGISTDSIFHRAVGLKMRPSKCGPRNAALEMRPSPSSPAAVVQRSSERKAPQGRGKQGCRGGSVVVVGQGSIFFRQLGALPRMSECLHPMRSTLRTPSRWVPLTSARRDPQRNGGWPGETCPLSFCFIFFFSFFLIPASSLASMLIP